jgi:hypothetical protein
MEGAPDFEKSDEKALHSIDMLLPRYHEAYTQAYGELFRYRILRSMPIDGHDVAWMEYAGQHFTGNSLHCACDFAEGVGWHMQDGEPEDIDRDEECLPRKVAQYLRQQELQREYIDRFDDVAFGGIYKDVYTLRDYIPQIVLDLLARKSTGEFIGDNGAHYTGGYLFAESIVGITDISYEELWPILEQMDKNGLINLNYGVIHPIQAESSE